jgi:glycosyltransferase involved in cell wall biosynthesis
LTSLPPLSEHPLVSVIVPSYNRDTYLRETLESILCQEYDHIEIIVVDGASTDQSLDILHSYGHEPRIRWISEPDSGPIEALSKGYKLATGELTGQLPVTDTYFPEAIKELVQEFTQSPSLAFVGGWNQEINEHGIPTNRPALPNKRIDYSLDDIIHLAGFPNAQATLYRRDIALAVTGFDEHDQESHGVFNLSYMLEASKRGGHVRAIPKVLANYRIHDNQRHTSNEHGGLTAVIQRTRGTHEQANKYRNFLTPHQVKTLRRTGYFFELRYRLRTRKYSAGALPALMGYIRFGGGPHVIKKLCARMLRPLGIH